ncbi:MAG: hypothetical protein JWN17_2552 [Frankiales bacterium]|nr:hypothetical protein [Frankiales bacterium]
MTLPPVGAWRRAGIARGDGPLVEDERVVWLQVGDAFADLRAGGEDPVAFAGRTTVEGDVVTWHHEVSTQPPATDVGRVEHRDGLLVETGTGDDGRPYVEHWVPLPTTGPALAHTAQDLRAVRVGDHVLVVRSSGACLLVGGVVVETVGTPPEVPVEFTQAQQERPARATAAP